MHQARRLCKEYEGVAGAAFIKLAHIQLKISNRITDASIYSFVDVLVQSYKDIALELNDMTNILRGTKFVIAAKVIGVYARLMEKQAEYIEKEVGSFCVISSMTVDSHREHLLSFSRSMSTDVEDQLIAV